MIEARSAFGVQRRLLTRGELDDDCYLTTHVGDPAWNLLHVRGPVDVGCLRDAVAILTAGTDTLRVRLRSTPADGPTAEWHDPVPVALQTAEVPALFADDRIATDAAAVARRWLFERPDLRRDPLARFGLVSAGAREHLLTIALDHTVADGWSIGLLLRRLVRCYRALTRGDRPAARRAVAGPSFADFVETLPPDAERADALHAWAVLLADYPLPGPPFQAPGGARKDPADCRLDGVEGFDVPPAAFADLHRVSARLGVTAPQTLAAVTCAFATLWSAGPQPIFHTRHGRARRADIGVIGPLIEMGLGVPPAGDLPVHEWLARYVAVNVSRPLYGQSLWETGLFAPRYVGFNVLPPARPLRIAPGTEAVALTGEILTPLWPDGPQVLHSYSAAWITYYLDDTDSMQILVQHDSELIPHPEAVVETVAAILAAAAAPDPPPMSALRAPVGS